jgi:hypothetical protein
MMREVRSSGGLWSVTRGALLGALICALTPALSMAAIEDPAAAAASLSNQAFAILNSLNAGGGTGTTSPLLGPIASFAGDAQTLSQALGKGDKASAGRAMAALKSDATALDAASRQHPGAIKPTLLNSLEQQVAALDKRVPPVLPPIAGAPPPLGATPPAASAPPPDTGGASGAGMAEGSSGAEGGIGKGPRIKITSRSIENGISHIKGYFEGTDLKSAGIYEGGQRVKPIKVDHILGRQKVEFDLALNGADIGTNLRVYDHAGRKAVASVYGGGNRTLAGTSDEDGVEVYRGGGTSSEGNTAEIPSHNRESLGGGSAPLSNVRIDITSLNVIDPLTRAYQITGQIDGHGVRHAGIYVDGRLVRQLPVSSGANVSAFNTTFIMNGGTATIRAFGAGNRYVETSIQMPSMTAPPMVAEPSPYYSPYEASPYAMSPPYSSGPSFNINIGPGGVTPYASPYVTSPYGAYVNPYASPYGSPYGSYATPPAAHPWGNAPRPPSASGW